MSIASTNPYFVTNELYQTMTHLDPEAIFSILEVAGQCAVDYKNFLELVETLIQVEDTVNQAVLSGE